jgi:cytochrome c oxidase subunit 2
VRRFFISGLLIAGLVILVGAGFLAWIGSRGGLTPVSPAAENSQGVQQLYVFIGAFASAIFLVVTVPLVLFMVRFRSQTRDRTVEGPQIRGHARLELVWTAIPVLILIAIGAFTFIKLGQIDNPTAQAAPGDVDLVVKVESRQFYWRFVYENGAVSFDTLRLPVDRKVRFDVTSPDWDVIHSFWVPALGPKIDAIPGYENHLRLLPEKTGTYQGKCAELCGIQHTMMLFTVQVMPQAEFDAWLRRAPAREDLGQEIFQQVCSKCHFAAPEYAPNIAGNPILTEPDALRVLIENGRRRMPPVGRGWSEREIRALLEFTGAQSGG